VHLCGGHGGRRGRALRPAARLRAAGCAPARAGRRAHSPGSDRPGKLPALREAQRSRPPLLPSASQALLRSAQALEAAAVPPAGPRLRSCVAQVVLLRLPQAALVHLGAVQLQEREPVWAGLLPAPLLALLLLKASGATAARSAARAPARSSAGATWGCLCASEVSLEVAGAAVTSCASGARPGAGAEAPSSPSMSASHALSAVALSSGMVTAHPQHMRLRKGPC